MKVISFNLKKITAERTSKDFSSGYTISTNIEFTSLDKDKVEMLKADEVFNLSFKFIVNYGDSSDKEKKDQKKDAKTQGEILFEGGILLATEKDEARDLLKSWKKKELPTNIRIPLFNMILKKCSSKALTLEEDINLPPHLPMPQIQQQPEQNQ